MPAGRGARIGRCACAAMHMFEAVYAQYQGGLRCSWRTRVPDMPVWAVAGQVLVLRCCGGRWYGFDGSPSRRSESLEPRPDAAMRGTRSMRCRCVTRTGNPAFSALPGSIGPSCGSRYQRSPGCRKAHGYAAWGQRGVPVSGYPPKLSLPAWRRINGRRLSGRGTFRRCS